MENKGPCKSAPPSAVLQQTVKIIIKKQFAHSFVIVMIFDIYLQANNEYSDSAID